MRDGAETGTLLHTLVSYMCPISRLGRYIRVRPTWHILNLFFIKGGLCRFKEEGVIPCYEVVRNDECHSVLRGIELDSMFLCSFDIMASDSSVTLILILVQTAGKSDLFLKPDL